MKYINLLLLLVLYTEFLEAAIILKSAHLENSHKISVKLFSPTHLKNEQVRIYDHHGEELLPQNIEYSKHDIVLNFDKKINFTKNYYIKIADEQKWVYPTLNLINHNFVSDVHLGARLNGNQLSLSLWSPTATAINFVLYDKDAKTFIGKLPLVRGENGVWGTIIKPQDLKTKNFDGLYYQYEVTAFGKTHLALDPYALSMAPFNALSSDQVGKAAIINLSKIKKPNIDKNNIKTSTDFIAYEVHLHDFTIDPNLNIENQKKGTYTGFTHHIPYLKELGITHVQFMPIQKFYTTNENDRSFQDNIVLKNNINYNWGYDPHNYFTPSGWYSEQPNNPYLRVQEVVSLFQELKKNDIGVILDVVYNHLYKASILDDVAPGCYLRLDNTSGEISTGTGAGVTLESRNLMARRLIIDSLKHWKNFYDVDGFRFDLMGFLDKNTVKEIRQALGPESILYGEAWDFTDLPHDQATIKTNFPHELGLSVFNDSTRDSYAGRNEGRGFAQGVFSEAPRVKAGIIGGLKSFPDYNQEIINNPYDRFAESPFETLNYLSIHDGFTLWDKINLSYGHSRPEREKIFRLSLGMLFTSQGRIVLHGGDELGRSKPLSPNDPHPERAHTSKIVEAENRNKFFHENTYRSPDTTNMLDWERAGDFNNLKNYLKGLIKLRRETPGLRYETATSIKTGLRFLPAKENIIAYIINNTLENSGNSIYKNLIIIHNTDMNSINLPIKEINNSALWSVLVDGKNAGIKPINNSQVIIENGKIIVPGKSTVVLGGLE